LSAGAGDLLGVTRVTVNRALSRLRRDGLIGPTESGGGNGRIRVLAPELLALRAASHTDPGHQPGR
jgi:DNA-binding FadR family transcriptional regulator